MLLFDMPLKDMQAYHGTNPRPADHDAYWARAIAEMEALPLDFELEPADITCDFADCFHLYFTGVGGARIHCQLIKPRAVKSGGAGLCIFHGYSGHSGSFADKLAYAAQGITCLAMDCRGQGGLSQDNTLISGNTFRGHIIRGVTDQNPDKLYFRQVYLDTAQAARILMNMEHIDPDRVGAYGRSQGGGLTLACASLTPRIRKIAPVFPFLCDFKRVWEIELYHDAYEEFNYYFRVMDPTHEREDEFFLRLGYIDAQHLSGRIQAETLWTIALADKVCPPSAQFAAYNKITAPKSMVMYHEYGHESLPWENDRIFAFLSQL